MEMTFYVQSYDIAKAGYGEIPIVTLVLKAADFEQADETTLELYRQFVEERNVAVLLNPE